MAPMHIIQILRVIFDRSLQCQLTSQTKTIKPSEDQERKLETYPRYIPKPLHSAFFLKKFKFLISILYPSRRLCFYPLALLFVCLKAESQSVAKVSSCLCNPFVSAFECWDHGYKMPTQLRRLKPYGKTVYQQKYKKILKENKNISKKICIFNFKRGLSSRELQSQSKLMPQEFL